MRKPGILLFHSNLRVFKGDFDQVQKAVCRFGFATCHLKSRVLSLFEQGL